jgi:phosphoribosylamine--glycine ligase
MGAYSTDDLLPANLRKMVISTIVEPTLRGLEADGISYQGFLYLGLMLTKKGPHVLEFNCRLGDPEAQAIVARMEFDLAEILTDAAAGRLEPAKLKWRPGASVCIVLASGGYPGKFESGKRIEGLTSLENNKGVKILHAGTRLEGRIVVTSGGRVVGVTAPGPTLGAAVSSAYRGASKIHFAGMHYRKDIGARRTPLKAAGD